MDALSDKIAADIAELIGEALPTGLSLRSAGSNILLLSSDQVLGCSPALEIIDDNDGRSLREKIEIAVRSALSGIQDVVIESQGDLWPGQSGHGADVPQPNCRTAGRELLVWFGDEAAPALSISPIKLG